MGPWKENMKEISILAVLVVITIYASFADAALRKICFNPVDNSTTYENCTKVRKWKYLKNSNLFSANP